MKAHIDSKLTDFILVFDGALPEATSRRLLAEYEPSDVWKPATIGVDREAREVRNCDVVAVSDEEVIGDSERRRALSDECIDAIKGWVDLYQEETTDIGIAGGSGIALLRYTTGGFYLRHHDSRNDDNRRLTAIGLLHTAFTGGELAFFGGEYVVDLAPGQVCVFPATFQYPHQVKPVLSGTRYSLTVWLR